MNTELLKNIIINLVKEGKYIIMSAHQMSTIEEFCSDILILNKGKTVIKGNLKEIKDTYPANRVQIETNENIETDIKKLGFEIENIKNYSYTAFFMQNCNFSDKFVSETGLNILILSAGMDACH